MRRVGSSSSNAHHSFTGTTHTKVDDKGEPAVLRTCAQLIQTALACTCSCNRYAYGHSADTLAQGRHGLPWHALMQLSPANIETPATYDFAASQCCTVCAATSQGHSISHASLPLKFTHINTRLCEHKHDVCVLYLLAIGSSRHSHVFFHIT